MFAGCERIFLPVKPYDQCGQKMLLEDVERIRFKKRYKAVKPFFSPARFFGVRALP